MMQLQQGFSTSEMGAGVTLHGSIFKPSMSPMGQSLHFEPGSSTSVKPPITEVVSPYSITSSAQAGSALAVFMLIIGSSLVDC